MHRISRIYVGNFGHKVCWYDGLLFNLVDEQTGDPADCIFQLVNAGGKSTLLSGIFSCFDTPQDRFLKHLQNPKDRFSDYFSPDGTPAIILVEWMIPTGGQQKNRRIVTGQAVSIKNSITNIMERVFFSFEAAPDLALESVPAPRLSTQAASSMEEFMEWLAATKRDYKGNIFVTKVLKEWDEHLQKERGIDVEMLKLQVEFSRSEGSIDTAFLNFKNETEFLQKFLHLTMDAERAAIVRQNVIAACEKFEKKPELETRFRVLSDLHLQLTDCEKSIAQMKHLKTEHLQTEFNSARFASTLSAKADELKTKIAEYCESIEQLESRLDDLRATKDSEESRLLGVQFMELKKRCEQAIAKFNECKHTLSEVDTEISYMRAGRDFAELESLRSQRLETAATMELAEQGLKPLKDTAKIQGKILKDLLTQHRENAEFASTNARKEQQGHEAEKVRLKKVLAEISKLLVREQGELSTLTSEQLRYKTACNRWFKEGVLDSEKELLNTGIERLESQKDSHQRLLAQNVEQESACESKLAELARKMSDVKQEISGKTQLLADLGADLSEAEALRETISQDRALCRAVESDVIDPDEASLVSLVHTYLFEIRRTTEGYAVILAQLKGDRTEIESTGLAGSSPDVQTIVASLREMGLETACTYNHYVASTEPVAENARELVCSDPARFLGVAVKSEKELEKAKEILNKSVSVSKPVVISFIGKESSNLSSGFVVPAENDAAYNFESANQYSEELKQKIDRQAEQHSTFESLVTETIKSLQKLNDYRERFGISRIANLRARITEMQEEVSHLQLLVQQFTEEQDQTIVQKNNARSNIVSQNEKLKTLAVSLQLIRRDFEELEAPAQERQKLIQDKTDLIDSLEDQKAANEIAEEVAQKLANDKEKESENSQRHAKFLSEEMLKIEHCDDSFDAKASLQAKNLSLDAARETYHNAATALGYKQQQQVGILKIQLENILKQMNQKEIHFNREHEKLDLEKVKSKISCDFEAELSRLTTTLKAARSDHDTSLTLKGGAEGEFNSFQRKNKDSVNASKEFDSLGQEELESEKERISKDILECVHKIKLDEDLHKQLKDKVRNDESSSKIYEMAASQLKAQVSFVEVLEPDFTLLPEESDLSKTVAEFTASLRKSEEACRKASGEANGKWSKLQKSVANPEMTQVEPDVSLQLFNNDFEQFCDSIERFCLGVEGRRDAAQTFLDSVKSDFEATVEELQELVLSGIRLLSTACKKRIPEAAPYLGGKPVIRMKVDLASIGAEERWRVLEDFMNRIIESGQPHKNGTDMVAHAIEKIAGKSLGIMMAKLIRDENEQYALVDKLSNSGGEAVSMALFLYILTAQIRAESHADYSRQPGGPLILDNPFAKAPSPFIWRAQRAFAKAMGVQLIFATPSKDLETMGEFEHFIHLRKAKQNNKTGRWHIEQVDLSLVGQS